MDDANLTQIKSLIQPNDRIIMAKKDILPLKLPVEQDRGGNYKPMGLWYAIGTEWIDWVESEMPDWIGDKFYKLETTSKVLKVDTPQKFQALIKEYGTYTPLLRYDPNPKRDNRIDWLKIANAGYAGIEIAPYRNEYRLEYMWYYGWDVASGCIWDKSGIKSIERVQV